MTKAKRINQYNAVILAGGFGTRLKSISGDTIKPMVKVCGKPVLEWQIELCKKHKFNKILMLLHHEYEQIIDYFGDGHRFDVEIAYHIEKTPKGTAGALIEAAHLFAEVFIVMYGDVFLDVNLTNMYGFHRDTDADVSVFAHPNSHPYDSDLIVTDENNCITGFHKYPHDNNLTVRNLVNAALYIFKRTTLNNITLSESQADVVQHLFPILLTSGWKLFAYRSQEYIKDMGTPDRLKKCIEDIETGVVSKLSVDQKREAIFLDRDGTIIEEVHFLSDHNQVKLINSAGNAIKKINESGMLSVVVTNQPVVARGNVTYKELDFIHAKMESMLGKERAYVDNIYFCPHHPDSGFDGEIAELKILCNCRKPKIGMFKEACTNLDIEQTKSWMIGDTTTDIMAGKNYGLKTILVRTGHAGLDKKYDAEPDLVASDILEAVKWILETQYLLNSQLDVIFKNLSGHHDIILIDGLPFNQKYNVAKGIKKKLNYKTNKGVIYDFQKEDANTIIQKVVLNNRQKQTSIVCGLGAFDIANVFETDLKIIKIFCNVDLEILKDRAEACREISPLYEAKYQKFKFLDESNGIEALVSKKLRQSHHEIVIV